MKTILFVAGGVLFAGFAVGLTYLVLMSNDGREMADNADRGSRTSANPNNDARSEVLPSSRQRHDKASFANSRTRTRGRSRAMADDNATSQQLAKGHGLLETAVLACLAGAMAIVGGGLVVAGLRSRPPRRRKHKHACTAVFVQNAGKGRQRTSVVPTTVSFSLASQRDEARRVSFLEESEKTEDFRRAG